jgi:hypothetical protein
MWVTDYNEHMNGVDKNDQLLKMYAKKGNRNNRRYMKLFRGLMNATVLNSCIIHKNNVGRKTDHLKCRVDLTEGFLVNYSKHHGGNKTVKRLDSNGMSSTASMTKEHTSYSTIRTVMLHCA